MQQPIRRADRKIDSDEAIELLHNCEYGVLSTVDKHGQPYGIPLNYVFSNNCIYFHCATVGHKLDNLRSCNRVSFCVVGDTEVLPDKFSTRYSSAVVTGSATEIFNHEKEEALQLLVRKYSPGFIREGTDYIAQKGQETRVIRIVADCITGKARK
jgi:nitroimidazol reductase NimA-like FMN-containing flavoprotein (pyridoxamine 5'-phosphate oxidase superfamily)